MKQGKSLVDMARELDRQELVKRDFQADTRLVKVLADDRSASKLVMEIPTEEERGHYPIAPVAVRQMGDNLRVPAAFIDRCSEYPDLLSGTFNYLLQAEPESRMIRTLDGRMRAYLSKSYRPMDNYDLFKAIYPALSEFGVAVQSCEVTEKRMYIKATVPGLEAEIPPPAGAVMGQGHTIFVDNVQAGISIMNSEIGWGRLAIQPGTFTARCTNLAVFKDYEFSKIHLGTRRDQKENVYEIYSDETKKAEDALLWNKVRDLVVASLDGKVFKKIVNDLTVARGVPIENNPVKAVEVFAKKYGLGETEKELTLENLVRSGDLTKYGLSAAVTRMSQDVAEYDRASELEELGGKVIVLKPDEFNVFAKAA